LWLTALLFEKNTDSGSLSIFRSEPRNRDAAATDGISVASTGSGNVSLRRKECIERSMKCTSSMNVERYLRMIAGAFVLLSLGLGYWVSPYWYLFTAFVGLNLFQSAFTGWCPMMTILRTLGARSH
jgi:hypothetical protein